MAGIGHGRPEKDFRGLIISDACWDGYHRPQSQYCAGWIMAGKKNEDDIRCQCPCHDPQPARTKPKKPVTLPLPDVGTIQV
jgi:hypothetical protein